MNVAWQLEGSLYRKSKELDVYGESQLRFVDRIKLGMVRFADSVEKSSVRADSSASRGKAEQEEFDAVMVTPLESKVQQGDIMLVDGVKLRVDMIHKRFGLRGRPGHLEVGASIWV